MSDILRERRVPSVRVFARIKDPLYGGKKRRFVQILGFNQVNTNRSVSGVGTASVMFPNNKSSLIRFVSIDNIKDTEEAGAGKETVVSDIFHKYLYGLSSRYQKNLFQGVWNDMTLFRAEKDFEDLGNLDLDEYSRSAGDLATDRDRNILEKVRDNKIVYALPFLDLFDPIFVDYRGQDGFWYAGFTGVITQVGDAYAKMGDQTLSITAKDSTVLFDNGSVVSGWHRMPLAEKRSKLREFVYSSEANIKAARTGAYANIFASDKYKKVTDIILKVLEVSQELWRLDGFGRNVGVYDFKYDTSRVYTYNGISTRRGAVQYVSDPENMNPEDFRKDYPLREKHYYYTSESASEKLVFVDPAIIEFDNKFIHKLLSNGLSLYKDSLKSADSIISDIVSKMLAYKYFDANGNLVIELPKLNSIPNTNEYAGRSFASILRHKTPKVNKDQLPSIETKIVKDDEQNLTTFVRNHKDKYDLTVAKLITLNGGYSNTAVFGNYVNSSGGTSHYLKKGAGVVVSKSVKPKVADPLKDIKVSAVEPKEAVFSRSSEDEDDHNRHTVLFHGNNYILTDDDFIAFNTSIDEMGLQTVATTDTTYPWLDRLNDNLLLSFESLHGVAVADYDKLAKLGVRRYQTQNIFNVTWPSPFTGARILSYQSAAMLERINAQVDAGTIQLNHRPDIQVGRNYLNLLRFKLYYIMGVTNTWTPGGPHTTTLVVSYGHPIHKALEVPWLAIFAEPAVFNISSIDDFFKHLRFVGADGDNKEEQELANPKGGVSTSG